MKKTLIALALTSLPVAAMADVVLYGQIKAGVEVSRVKATVDGKSVVKATVDGKSVVKATVDGKSVKSRTATEIADFGSRIGFKGSETVAPGLNAIWQVENKVSVAGGGEWASRDSFIGLEGNFGKIRAGKLSTQLNDMGTIDTWEYNNNALGLGVFTRTGTREASVRYDTPNFAGFSANVQYTPRDNAKPDDKYIHEVAAKDAYYAGLNYANAGWFAQYGAAYRNNAQGAGKNGQVHRVEAGYDANNLFVGVGAQYTKNWDTTATYVKAISNGVATADGAYAADGIKTTEAAVTAAYRFGNVTPKISYAHGWKAKAKAKAGNVKGDVKLDGTQYNQVVLGADYDFSKRTTAFAQAGWLKAGSGDNKIENTAGLVGLRHKF